MYLLDTDHAVFHFGSPCVERASLARRLAEVEEQDVFLPIICFHEQFAGWQSYLRRRRDASHVVHAYRRLELLVDAFKLIEIAPFDQAAAHEFDSQRSQGVRIGTFDLRIASIALTRDFTVLTRNAVDFEKVPGLRHEDWTLPHRPK